MRKRTNSDYRGRFVGARANAVQMRIAFAMLMRFPRRVPNWQHIAAEFRMSRATAYRWRRALMDARGIR